MPWTASRMHPQSRENSAPDWRSKRLPEDIGWALYKLGDYQNALTNMQFSVQQSAAQGALAHQARGLNDDGAIPIPPRRFQRCTLRRMNSPW